MQTREQSFNLNGGSYAQTYTHAYARRPTCTVRTVAQSHAYAITNTRARIMYVPRARSQSDERTQTHARDYAPKYTRILFAVRGPYTGATRTPHFDVYSVSLTSVIYKAC